MKQTYKHKPQCLNTTKFHFLLTPQSVAGGAASYCSSPPTDDSGSRFLSSCDVTVFSSCFPPLPWRRTRGLEDCQACFQGPGL